jgi:hypothetical protein
VHVITARAWQASENPWQYRSSTARRRSWASSAKAICIPRAHAAAPGGGSVRGLEAIFAGEALTYEKAYGRTAGAAMTRNVFTVEEDAPLNEIAELLERPKIKRVPILSDGRLAGIVRRASKTPTRPRQPKPRLNPYPA